MPKITLPKSGVTGKATTAQQYAADPGYYTGIGYSQQSACDIGYYTPGANYSECLTCPQGAYCPSVATSNYTLCPAGAYCQEGSYTYTLCPASTYSNSTGMSSINDCNECPEGKYCDTNGLIEPVGDCAAGYYCNGSSPTEFPLDASYGSNCPLGHYCPLHL